MKIKKTGYLLFLVAFVIGCNSITSYAESSSSSDSTDSYQPASWQSLFGQSQLFNNSDSGHRPPPPPNASFSGGKFPPPPPLNSNGKNVKNKGFGNQPPPPPNFNSTDNTSHRQNRYYGMSPDAYNSSTPLDSSETSSSTTAE